ncbi:DnaJ C-terminal domain-containing protein, partial [Chloroflexota bacterium]
GGNGSVESTREIHVSIPKGADTGYAIRIEGEGAPGVNGNGDLYVVIRVEKHPIFERHGDDIYMVQEVEFPLAALGGELDDIPGLEGNVSLDIPEGTQNGAVLRIIGKGIPHFDDQGSGDEYVVINVVTPIDLTEEEKDLLRRFQKSRRQHPAT